MDQSAITALVERVGWAQVLPPFVSGITVDMNAAGKSESGRTFKAFHALATAENVYYSIPNQTPVDNDGLNQALNEIREQAVLDIIDRVFVQNPRAMIGTDGFGNPTDLSGTDYSEMAIRFAPLFDTAIGLKVACTVVEQIISSPQINSTTRKVAENLTLNDLKAELNGAGDGSGNKIEKGLYALVSIAVRKIIDILFPVTTSEKKPELRDSTSKW